MPDNPAREEQRRPRAAKITMWLTCCVFIGCLCWFVVSLFPGSKDPYITGLEEVLHTATSMEVSCISDTVLIEDPEQIRATAKLILDGMDGSRTFIPSYAAGGKVYGYTFYRDDQPLYRVIIHPEIGQAINHTLPDHTRLGNDQERKTRRYNSQFYANTNHGALLKLCDELLP